MVVAYFDCQFGAAGDMLLGAMIAAGLPEDQWRAELSKIALPEDSFSVQITDVVRCSIASKRVHVQFGQESDEPRPSASSHWSEHEHSFHPDEHHSHSHPIEMDTQAHSHGRVHAHEHRGLTEILKIIHSSKISSAAKTLAAKIFQQLGEAEAKIHGIPVEQVHFHEVGAIDAIIDIVGFAIAYDLLGITTSFVSALPLGTGTVRTAHGEFPVPAPATALLLAMAGAPIRPFSVDHECLTPTGAAILSVIADKWGSVPPFQHLTSVGYGAGGRNPSTYPNVCRVFLGTVESMHQDSLEKSGQSAVFASEVISVVEANLDDFSPQALAFVVEQLQQQGALDVTVTPMVMKKGRSGHLLSVLCKPVDRAKLESLILTDTSSIGVRSYDCERRFAERRWQKIELGEGTVVRVKVALDANGAIVNAQAEYEDCAAYARRFGLPIKEVMADAAARIRNQLLQ